ncbi:hypothetical protein [Gilliamella sp. GillExp13]|uniref:hypothetical protein n=1 Tax=Gilliamella sp. GillExp13 TaxID=3120243 RepID=UPI00080E81C5|nr:hypothetical protein [Gilliamella apicola]OCG58745.1 hypothetical protein A9G37_06540 [Gilliamella apicola]
MNRKREIEDYVRKELTSQPPKPCDFKVGDIVIYKNDFGVKFECKVIGFSVCDLFKYGKFIHLDNEAHTTAYWCPHHPDSLSHK